MPNAQPWFKFWVQDWLSSKKVKLLKPYQRAAYFHLLCYLWIDSNCSLPNDRNTCLSLADIEEHFNGCMTEEDAEDTWKTLERLFQPHPTIPNALTNSRLYHEWLDAKQLSEARSRGGLHSAKNKAKTNSYNNEDSSKTLSRHNPVRQKSESESESDKEKRRKKKSTVLDKLKTDAIPVLDFLDAIKANPAYKGIDIDREIGRMNAWLLTPRGKRRKLTAQFVVNWLNKVDVPIEVVKTIRVYGGGEDE